jgi:TPR repeat protein
MKRVVTFFVVLCSLTPQYLHAGYEEGFEAASKGSYNTALVEFQIAAEKGDVRAQYSLGIMYFDGIGVKKDHDIAVKWLKKAADKGHPAAQQILKRNQ